MYLEDPNSQITSMAPQQYVTGYYPMYMNYPQMPANLPQIGRQPQPRISKWSPRKPSTFRPQGDSEQNEHNAVNEQDILFLIKEYEDKNNNFNVLVGRIVGLAVTQTGSRFLQKQLTKSNPDFVTFVLKEVYNCVEDAGQAEQWNMDVERRERLANGHDGIEIGTAFQQAGQRRLATDDHSAAALPTNEA